MNFKLTEFQEYELKELIPTYGENLNEIIKYIILNWLSKEGASTIRHNIHVKELILINKNKNKK